MWLIKDAETTKNGIIPFSMGRFCRIPHSRWSCTTTHGSGFRPSSIVFRKTVRIEYASNILVTDAVCVHDLITTYKVIFGLLDVSSNFFVFRDNSVTRGHPYKVMLGHCDNNSQKQFYRTG